MLLALNPYSLKKNYFIHIISKRCKVLEIMMVKYHRQYFWIQLIQCSVHEYIFLLKTDHVVYYGLK